MTETAGQSENTILDALNVHGLLGDDVNWQLTPATGGQNSRVYYAGPSDSQPVLTVRVSRPGRAHLLQRESDILQQVAGTCTCTPAVRGLLQIDAELLLVHDHAAGIPLPLSDASPAQMKALAACLARIHSHAREHYAIWPDLTELYGTRAQALTARLSAVQRYVSFTDRTREDLWHCVQHIYQTLRSGSRAGHGWEERTFSLLHGDLSPGNIIWNAEVVILIDWEYARPGDPAEDIAYLFAEQDVHEDQMRVLAKCYVAAGGDPTAISRIPAYSALVSLDSALWWADLNLQRGNDPTTSPEVAYHLSRARQALTQS